MTPAQRMRELIMCPLQRCYPLSKRVMPQHRWNSGGRFLSVKETAALKMLDQQGRDQLIAQIVVRMREIKQSTLRVR